MHDVKPTGTFTTLARYTVYDIGQHTFTPLTYSGKGTQGGLHQYASWVPGSSLVVCINLSLNLRTKTKI